MVVIFVIAVAAFLAGLIFGWILTIRNSKTSEVVRLEEAVRYWKAAYTDQKHAVEKMEREDRARHGRR